jgi:hypothetical protein
MLQLQTCTANEGHNMAAAVVVCLDFSTAVVWNELLLSPDV